VRQPPQQSPAAELPAREAPAIVREDQPPSGAPIEPVQPAEPRESRAAAQASVTGTEETTHTVRRNETLWGIAEQYRSDAGTNINQMMLSIYRANPDRREADSEVQRQNREWQGLRTETAPAPETPRLELVPPPETQAPAPAAKAPAPAAPPAAPALQAELEESRRLLAARRT
jgi:hypothetical protein